MKYFLFSKLQALKEPYSRQSRAQRIERFLEIMKITGQERIVDLGGAPGFWKDCPMPLDITIVNLPGYNDPNPGPSHHKFTMLEGDACDMPFDDQSFDLAFSNSVIEHVGDEAKQAAMAQEVRRLAPAYWVQTPSIWFPIEAHNNMPFWWFYPPVLKRYLIRRWREKLPQWTEMVETTTVLSLRHLRNLFPDAEVYFERQFGFTKSYSMYKSAGASAGIRTTEVSGAVGT